MPAPDLTLLDQAAREAGEIALRYWRQSPEAWDKGGGAGGPSHTVVLLPGGDAEYVETNRSYGVGGTGSDPAPAGGAATELRVTTQ